jgi:hypothetical protein
VDYKWSYLFKDQEIKLDLKDMRFIIPSTFYSIMKMFLSIIFYFLLTWYFDHIDSSNRGRYYKYLFFLEGKYWTGVSDDQRRKEKERQEKKLEESKSTKSLDRIRLLDCESESSYKLLNNMGVEIKGLSKTYNSGNIVCPRKVNALTDVFYDNINILR